MLGVSLCPFHHQHPPRLELTTSAPSPPQVSQDDGPLGPGVRLYEFFEQNNISSTHFYTGSNIIRNFGVFLQCRSIPGQHFAVHSCESYPDLPSHIEAH